MKKRIMENIDGVEVVKMFEVRVPSERKRDRAKAFKQLHIDDMYGMLKRLEKRVEELEYERWKKNLQEDHVRYDFIGDNNEDDS